MITLAPGGVGIGAAATHQIAQAVRTAGGREVCGFLLVSAAGGQSFALARNDAPAPGSFSVSPDEAERIRRYAAGSGLRVAAFIHSHPVAVLELSQADAACLARSRIPWIVVHLDGERLMAKWHPPPGGPGS